MGWSLDMSLVFFRNPRGVWPTIFSLLLMTLPNWAMAQDDAIGERLVRVNAIKAQLAEECLVMNKAEEEYGVLPLKETNFSLKWFEDSIYDIEITPDGRKATVVYLDAVCPNFGSGYCGSGGCTFFIVVGDRTFSYKLGGRPYPVTHGDAVSIAVPLGGYACKDTKGVAGFGNDPCYDFIFWNEATRDFMAISDDLARVE